MFITLITLCRLLTLPLALNDITADVSLLNSKSLHLLSSLILGGQESARVAQGIHEAYYKTYFELTIRGTFNTY